VTSSITAAGLVLDIAGATILASALVFSPVSTFLAQNWGGESFSPLLDIGVAEQRADAYVGLSLLIGGFVAQFDQALDWNPHWASLQWTVPAALSLVVGSWLLLRYWLRPRLVANTIATRFRQEAEEEAKEGDDSDRLAYAIARYATADGLPSGAEIIPEEYAVNLIGSSRWKEVIRDLDLGDAYRSPYLT
jgi:hypothetical protein